MTDTIIMGKRGIKVYFMLGRRLLSNILTVYLPTVLLNLIGHLTVYFKPFFFEAIITVNLTVMLVITTMFISVSNSLPMTSYVKMIDIWLLFNLVVPFVEVFMQTYIEHLRSKIEDKKEMNHHGRSVTVDTGTKIAPVGEEKAIRSVNELIQRDALKEMYERK